MKKVLTLALALVMTFGTMAQKTYRLNNDKQDAKKTERVRTLNVAKKSIDKDNIKKLNLNQAKAMSVEVTDISLANGELTATITPNAEVASYFYMAANPNNQEFAQYVQLLQMFGMTETDAVAALADNAEAPATGTQTVTMNASWVAPGETNNVYVVALDANENAQMFTVPFTAPALGDHGNAAVTVNVPTDSITTSSVYISMTPNASTSYYYYLIYEDSDFAADNWNNDSVMNYFTTQAPKNYFERAGKLTVSPNENYTVYTLAYNIDSVTDGIQTYSFATQTVGGHGTPAVTVEIPADSVTATSFYVSFAPNSEVAHYYYTIIDSATVASMSWTADSVMSYMLQNDEKAYDTLAGNITKLAPGTIYNVYTLAANLDGAYSDLVMLPVRTTVIGGHGTPAITVTVENVTAASADLTITPNSEVAYYYYLIATDAQLQAGGMTTDADVQAYLENENAKKYFELSGPLNGLTMGTTYKVYAIGYNLDGTASSIAPTTFTTQSLGGSGLAEVAVNVEVVDGAATISTTMNDQTAYYYYAYFAGINGYGDEEIFEVVDGNAQRQFFENINIDDDPLEEGEEYGIFVVPYNGNNEQGTPVAVRFTSEGVMASLVDVDMASISVYPNPAKNVVSISAPSAIDRIEMMNVLGQKVYENATIGSENTTINVSDLDNGTYFVRIFCGNKMMTKKLIVK
mgnify:CR=1 FL=1